MRFLMDAAGEGEPPPGSVGAVLRIQSHIMLTLGPSFLAADAGLSFS